jgi:hypothetical protein
LNVKAKRRNQRKIKLKKFIGNWKLKSFELKAEDGGVSRPFGDTPKGLISYSQNGMMSVQLHHSERPRFAQDGFQAGTDSEIRAAFETYVAYYGTYEVNEEKKFVTHHLQGSLIPNQSNSLQRRYFEFLENGAILQLKSEPMPVAGAQLVGVFLWSKID